MADKLATDTATEDDDGTAALEDELAVLDDELGSPDDDGDDVALHDNDDGGDDKADDDDSDAPATPVAAKADDEDEDEDEDEDDVEADLDTILKERLATTDDEDEDDEDVVKVVTKDRGDTSSGKGSDEILCNNCFLIIKESQLGPAGVRTCPSGADETDCAAIIHFGG